MSKDPKDMNNQKRGLFNKDNNTSSHKDMGNIKKIEAMDYDSFSNSDSSNSDNYYIYSDRK